MGCPPDEFDAEIRAVARQIDRIVSIQDATHVLSRVFSSAFEPSKFKVEDCAVAGRRIFDILEERDLLANSGLGR